MNSSYAVRLSLTKGGLVMGDPIKFEIFIDDLTEDARRDLEDIIGSEHNYDVFPIAVLQINEEGGVG